MPINPKTQDLKTLTVLQSYPAATPDGRIALVFRTKELGPIAFEITDLGSKALRQTLAQVDVFLSQKSGQA